VASTAPELHELQHARRQHGVVPGSGARYQWPLTTRSPAHPGVRTKREQHPHDLDAAKPYRRRGWAVDVRDSIWPGSTTHCGQTATSSAPGRYVRGSGVAGRGWPTLGPAGSSPRPISISIKLFNVESGHTDSRGLLVATHRPHGAGPALSYTPFGKAPYS